MKYATAAAFRTALETRLKTLARKHDIGVNRLRKILVFDRLLARLRRVAPNRWVLKGGLALDFRLGTRARATKDMDLARRDDEESALADLIAAQTIDLGDHFVFRSERVGAPGAGDIDTTVRFRIQAELAARPFDTVLLDVGFSDPHLWKPDLLRGLDLLEFAELEPAEVPVLPLEQHIAEKVHAYTREYTGGRASTRVKDLVDLVLIASFTSPDGARLHRALEEVFTARGTHLLPDVLPAPPSSWRRPFGRLVRDLDLATELQPAHAEAADLVDPVLRGRDTGRWNPATRRWERSVPAT